MNYDDLVEIRKIDIMGENDWYWIKSDTGCFGDENDGPMRDWIQGHSEKYFKHLNNYDVVVTGGTSCGMHARFYAKKFKYVYAFEPDPLSFHCMVNNAQFDNVIKLNAAIGHTNGIVGLKRVSEDNVGMHHLVDKNEFHIPMLSIDSLNLDACDLIQLDVEGFEQSAINGAKKTIEKFKPVIIGERFGTEENMKFMKNIGYNLIDRSFMDFIYVPEKTNKTFVYKI